MNELAIVSQYKMKYLSIILILAILHSCESNNNMKSEQKKIIENYIKSYNNFEIDNMTKDLHQEVIFENISNGKVDLKTEGIEEFKKQAETAKQYFNQRTQTIESWEFNETKVTIKIDYNAILNIDLPNGLKKGDTLELKGESQFEFDKGKIVSIKDKS